MRSIIKKWFIYPNNSHRLFYTSAQSDQHFSVGWLDSIITVVISSPEPSGSQGELIVYPWSGVRRRRPSTFFKHLLLRNRMADQSQNLCGASLGRGNESLYK